MWGIISLVSLCALIVSGILIGTLGKYPTGVKVAIVLSIISFIALLISFIMWIINKKKKDNGRTGPENFVGIKNGELEKEYEEYEEYGEY